MDTIATYWNEWLNMLPNAVAALVLLLIGFLVAWIAKKAFIKVMKLVKIEKLLDKAKMSSEQKEKLGKLAGKLIFFVVFILFLPGIFGKLGLSDIASPISNMVNIFLTYLPNLIAAIVLLVIGLFVAKTVKELLLPVFKKLKINSALEKIGFDTTNKNSVAEALATVVYVLILIPVLVAALSALKIDSISQPAINMLDMVMAYLPKIALAIAIVFVGKFIASVVEKLLEKVLDTTGINKFSRTLAEATGTKETKISLSKFIAVMAQIVINIFFIVEALHIIDLDVLTNIGTTVIDYLPFAISAAVIMALALVLGGFVENKIKEKFPKNTFVAFLTKIVIIVVGVFITLSQLGIAQQIVNSAFIIILGAFAVAFAIAFGVGGREFAANTLKKLEKKNDK